MSKGKQVGTGVACVGGALLLLAAGAVHGQAMRSEEVIGGFFAPVGIESIPGDIDGTGNPRRIFVVQQNGFIRTVDLTQEPPVQVGTFLSWGSNTVLDGERGLLGLAFHPDFLNNGRFFINYSRPSDGANVISELRASNPTSLTSSRDTTIAEDVLLVIPQDFANHNGGQTIFGPDGMLYISSGDGGSANDPNNRGQSTNTLLGKILRLDVDDRSTADGDGELIPDDNPFRGTGDPLDEILATGARNPWRMSFDSATGDLYIADVGQSEREEISVLKNLPATGIEKGLNLGWRCYEGTRVTNLGGCNPLPSPVRDPIHEEAHNGQGHSITGGFVYRGTAIDGLQGAYLYADFERAYIRSLRYDSATDTVTDLRDWTSSLAFVGSNTPRITSFGQDSAGELYFCSVQTGSVYKIVPLVDGCGCPCAVQGAQGEILVDDFENDAGWTTGSVGATAGFWQRGVPVNDAGWEYDPVSDSDGSGSCYLTQNVLGNSDVDNGEVTLTSPVLDLSDGEISICYDYYVNKNGANPEDGLFVEISTNGLSGPWTQIASHTADNDLAWSAVSVTQSELDTLGVTVSADSRIRFRAIDANPQSLVECAIDNVSVLTGNPFDDCNGNGVDDLVDITMGTSLDCNANNIPDECDIASGLVQDCEGGPLGEVMGGMTVYFDNSCFSCHGNDGLGSSADPMLPGPNIRNQTRASIRTRLTTPGLHPGGLFTSLTGQDYADLESFLSDNGSLGRSDGVPDSCQTASNFADCDNDGTTDGCELAGGTQVDLDFDGVPDDCCVCDTNTDGILAVGDVLDFLGLWSGQSPGGDFNNDGIFAVGDILDFLACWSDGCP